MTRAWALAALVPLTTACVAFDAEDPVRPPLAGDYQGTLTVSYSNHLESRMELLPATVTLPNSGDYGRFDGEYVTSAGDRGIVTGYLDALGNMRLPDFPRATALPASAAVLQRVYPWCDFSRSETEGGLGLLIGDTVQLYGRVFLPCRYQVWSGPTEIRTDLSIFVVGIR